MAYEGKSKDWLKNRVNMCHENMKDSKKRALAALNNARFWKRELKVAEAELFGFSQGEFRFVGPNSGREYEIP